MAHLKFKFETLNAFCNEAFEKFGFTSDESKTITDVLLLSDVYGIESHGMQRLSRYHKGIEKGMIKVDAKPEIVFETPVSAVIDGHAGMGQLISKFAMEKCIEKAKTVGMAIVTVRNSNHYGIAGYYAKMACDEGLMGMSFTNSEAIMVPTFARKAMLGSNPIALAMPAKPYPFFFDASTTVVTRGKLEMYRKAEKELPEGWAFIRLNTAWELISGRDLSPSEYNDKNDGIPYITGASNFRNGHISLVRWTTVPQVITRRGDLLLTCKGTIGEIAHNNFGEAHIARQIMAIRNIYSLNVDFLALCIEYSMTKIKQAAKGLIPGISREDILNLVIPIPPTKEQENICNKLKTTFSAIEHIEKSLN